MASMRMMLKRLLGTLGRRETDAELDEEIRFHIEMETRRLVKEGMDEAGARRQALTGFGGIELAKEDYRDQSRLPLVDTLIQDVRYGLRMLWNNRGFTAVAVVTLALGIGANTAIFSVVNTMLLQPLPYEGSQRIVMVWEDYSAQGGPEQEWIELPNFYEWKKSEVWETLSGFGFNTTNLTSGDDPLRLNRGVVNYDFLSTFGVAPEIGRNFVEADDQPGAPPVAIISHGLWQRAFGRAPILGGKIQLGGAETTVVGVLPRDFQVIGVPPVDVWTPLQLDPSRQSRGNFFLQGIGRLKEDVSLQRAQAEMDVIMERISAEFEINRGVKVNLVPLLDQLVAPFETGLWVLLGIVGFVLLIACANIANLMLSRGATRSREMAIRQAMGAGRWRIFRQLLTESILLSLLGAVFGVLLAYWGTQALVARVPAGIAPRIDSVGLDSTVLLFTLAVSLAAGLIFGFAPALQSRRRDITEGLREGGREAQSSGAGSRLRAALAAGQVALALCLVIASGLAIRSFQSLMDVDPGFRPAGLTTAQINMPATSYAGRAELTNFLTALIEGIASEDDVEAVTASSKLPMLGNDSDSSFRIEGRPEPARPEETPAIWYRRAAPGYFRTMGIPLLEGRTFNDGDHAQAPKVVLINQEAADRYWPNEEAVGRRVKFGDGEWNTIVGVVANIRYRALDREPPAALYFPYAQRPGRLMNLVIRSGADPTVISEIVRANLKRLDPEMPMSTVQTLESLVESSVAPPRFFMSLTSAFGFLALLLAGVGLYGVMAYSVSRRTSEMGVRMALGADRRDVVAMIVRQGLTMTVVGVAVGLLLAVWAMRLMASLLFQISPNDVVSFAVAVIVLLTISVAACFVPALRATRIDPLRALRAD